MGDSKAYGRGQVLEIINTVIDKIDGTVSDKREIYMHIAELASTIDSLKKEVASSRPDHVKNSHVPDAKDELDAIVGATAVATNTIMGVCEGMDKFAEQLDENQRAEMSNFTMQIYEACSFQDITGQRVSKIIKTLREIEEKVERIMATLDSTVGPLRMQGEAAEKQISVEDEQSLLNGPQMADKAISQEEIDRLLASFD